MVVSEGGCVFILEKLDMALQRKANILAEVVGYAINTDATDRVLPCSDRQAECMDMAINKAGITPHDIDLINTHATSTTSGDKSECKAINSVFGGCDNVYVNNSKSFIGHTMGASGILELAGQIPSFYDGFIHHTINIDNLDPECAMKNLVMQRPLRHDNVHYILKNSFGMLGINTSVIIKRYKA